MKEMTSWVGILVFGCGLYCFYAAIQLKVKGIVNASILLSKDLMYKTCKDKEGYIREAFPMLLIFAITTTFCGAVDLYNTFVKEVGVLYIVSIIVFIAGFVYFMVKNKKLKEKYY